MLKSQGDLVRVSRVLSLHCSLFISICPTKLSYSASLNSGLLLNSARPPCFVYLLFLVISIPIVGLRLTIPRARVHALQTEPARCPKTTLLCLGSFSLDFAIDMKCVCKWKGRVIIGFPHLYPFFYQSEIMYCLWYNAWKELLHMLCAVF